MTVLTDTSHAGEFLISEANGHRSREAITVLSGQDLKACTLLGRVLAGGEATAQAFAGNTGNGAMGTITVGAGAKPGIYRLIVVAAAENAGAFVVEGPDGVVVGTGDVAAAFSGGGLGFTLADGSTDFAPGDGFGITVTGGWKYKAWNPSNTDGSQAVAGILWDAVDASSGDARGAAIVRDAEINGAEIEFFEGATSDDKAAGLAALANLGIIAR